MRRRELITLFGGAAAVRPLAVLAQTPALPVVGMLFSSSPRGMWLALPGIFRQGLTEQGYTDRSLTLEPRWAEGEYDRLPAMASELSRHVQLIAAFTTPAAQAAKAATQTIPVVFTTIADPVQIGLVASLARPGGNLTGITQLSVEVGPKLLELLHAAVPAATVVAALLNPMNPNSDIQARSLQEAARRLALQLHVLSAATGDELDRAFEQMRLVGASALVLGQDPVFNSRIDQLVELSIRHGLPTIYPNREFVHAGGLMSYGSSLAEMYRQVGVYAGRILKGEKPANLPVMQASKFEMLINLKTAKGIGLTLSPDLLSIADEVIE